MSRRSQDETREPGRYQFHYDRDERLSQASEELKGRLVPQSFFKRYRGPLFIFFDIVILVIMLLIYLFISGEPSTASLPGYSLSMAGVEFGTQGLVVIRIRQTEDNPAIAGNIVTVTAKVDGTSLERSEKDVLPTRKGQERVFRFVLEPLPGASAGSASGAKPRTFQATGTVTAGDRSQTLTARLKSE